MKRTVFLKTTLALSLAFSAITSVVAQPGNATAYPVSRVTLVTHSSPGRHGCVLARIVKIHVTHHENQHGG